MTIQKLERVMWRVRGRFRGKDKITKEQLEVCVMREIGTDPRTFKYTKQALLRLGWLIQGDNGGFFLTNKDLTG